MRIVHLALDQKHVPLMMSLFEEAFPRANRHVILISAPGPYFEQHVRGASNVVFRSQDWFRSYAVARDLSGADLVVMHSAHWDTARALPYVPARATLVWIGWGYEYPELLDAHFGRESFLALTESLVPRNARDLLFPWLYRFSELPLLSIASRIDIACCHPADQHRLREALPQIKAHFHVIPHYTVEDVFSKGPLPMFGPDILVGNSGAMTNNHLDAMALLQSRSLAGRLVVPLSYGDPGYREQVVAKGREWFGDRFVPLIDWMPTDQYNACIGACGFVVMNHLRQQAVGNIGTALYKGATVYLRSANPLFDFYTALGITLRAVEDLEADPEAPLRPLREGECAANREAIRRYYERSTVVGAIRQLAALVRETGVR